MNIKYILKRLLVAVPVFFGIMLLVYIISSLAPGSPLDALLADPKVNAAELEKRRLELGLDQPVIVQYFTWFKEFLNGNLGYSYSTHRLVSDMIRERVGITAILAGTSILLSLLVSLPIGIVAASKPNSPGDYSSRILSFIMVATPNFFMGLMLIYIFSVVLKILPSGGMYDTSGTKTTASLLRHMILPCLVLSFQHIGSWVRYIRSCMLEVLQEDYIRTAKAKGLRKWGVIFRHGIKNALIPVAAVVGMSVPSLVGGAVVTEQVFGWPGIGTLMVQSIRARDYPVIMGITAVVAITVLVCNIATDLLYGVLDPRIRYE